MRGMNRLLSILALAASASCAFAQGSQVIAHQFIVRIDPDERIHDVLETYGAVVVSSYPSRGLYLLEAIPGGGHDSDDDAWEHELHNDNRIAADEQNRENYSEDGHTQSFFVGIVPIDFATQPTWDVIGLPFSPVQWNGDGVTVAVLDTGVAPHNLFAYALRGDGASFVDARPATQDYATGVDSNNNGEFDELAGHGTFLAGLINHIAPGSQILPIRVLDSDGVGSSFSVAAGIYYAIDHGANVINLSLSSSVDSLTVREAVQAAQARGVVVVAATGNSGSTIPQYPAANTGVIGVGATDFTDHFLASSDRGAYLRYSAPGQDIVSTFPGNLFARANGTSASAALVTGSVARLKSRLPVASSAVLMQMLYGASRPIDALNMPLRGMVGRRVQVPGKVLRLTPVSVQAVSR